MSQSSFRVARRTRRTVALAGLLFCALTAVSAHTQASATPPAGAAGSLSTAESGEETTGWD
ncbi:MULTISPECIES: hypothetical protein [unclassified Streptomyces]|uniref:hypothetical protein n=1 Tax=unclassified Streptomyces TaxID=2593676 RepID=UPI000CD54AEE|nr:hypothetical protein [Streptomyces sp. SM10]